MKPNGSRGDQATPASDANEFFANRPAFRGNAVPKYDANVQELLQDIIRLNEAAHENAQKTPTTFLSGDEPYNTQNLNRTKY
jgi:hypothetical protein